MLQLIGILPLMALIAGRSQPPHSNAQVCYAEEVAYGANPSQRMRVFFPPAGPAVASVLWFENSGYSADNELAGCITPASGLPWYLLASNVAVIDATVTHAGQQVQGMGRFLPPNDPGYWTTDRVERDATLAMSTVLGQIRGGHWNLPANAVFAGGHSGGSHPALWLAYHESVPSALRPRGVIAIGLHSWWPAWNQNLASLPSKHFYHKDDPQHTGLPSPSQLWKVKYTDQVASSLLHWLDSSPQFVPVALAATEADIEVTSFDPLPAGTITAPHSPWFTVAASLKIRSRFSSAQELQLNRVFLNQQLAPKLPGLALPITYADPVSHPRWALEWLFDVLASPN